MSEGWTAQARTRWCRFWETPGPTAGLGLFRVLFCVALLREVETSLLKSRFAIEGGIHLPYVDWIPLVSAELYFLLHLLQVPLVLLLGLGLATRAASVGLLALQGYLFFADHLNFRNHPYFFLMVLLVLAAAPAGDAFSVRALLPVRLGGRGRFLGTVQPLAAQRLILVVVSLVYLFAGLHKLNDTFLSGELLARQFEARLTRGDLASTLERVLSPERIESLVAFASHPPHVAPLAVGSAALELILPFALWIPRFRPVAVAAGVCFHVGIGMTMGIWNFSIAMLGTYLLFADPWRLESRMRLVLQRAVGEPIPVVDPRLDPAEPIRP